MTTEEFAKKIGVSRRTVSGVINHRDYVSQKTRDCVLQAMQRYHFVPNHMARQLVSRKTTTMGVIVRNISDPFWPGVMQGIETVSEQHGYTVLFIDSFEDVEREARALATCRSYKVAGVILGPVYTKANFGSFEQLKREHIPLVLLDRVPGYEGNWVTGNDEKAGYEVTTHLAKLGYRSIGYLGRANQVAATHARLRGYRRALKAAGLELNPQWVVEVTEQSEEAGYEACLKLLNRQPRLRALFVYCDILAIGCLQAAHELRLRVPQDLAIASIDDIPFAAHCRVPLTTLRIDQFEIGRRAADILVELAAKSANQRYASPHHEVIPLRLVVRESCGAEQ